MVLRARVTIPLLVNGPSREYGWFSGCWPWCIFCVRRQHPSGLVSIISPSLQAGMPWQAYQCRKLAWICSGLPGLVAH